MPLHTQTLSHPMPNDDALLNAYPTREHVQVQEARIVRFKERQYRKGVWLSISDVVELYAIRPGDASDEAAEREKRTYELIYRAIVNGQFFVKGRSRVLYLNPKEQFRLVTEQTLNLRALEKFGYGVTEAPGPLLG